MPQPILRLALPSPLRRLFDYRAPAGVPHAALLPGVRLRVPFGRREVIGILVELADSSPVADDKLRPALELLDTRPPLPATLFRLCLWTAQYYQHSLGDTLSWALPVLLRQGEPAEARQERFWHLAEGARLDDPRLARAPRQREALKAIAQHAHGLAHGLLGKLQLNKESLDLLLAKGLVRVETRRSQVSATHQGAWLLQPELTLNGEQRAAFEAVRAGLGRFQPFLLAGVTGSGKTEVYLQAIARCLEQGRQALVLVPEIGLTPQMLARFRSRLGIAVHALHSGLNDNERARVWAAAARGQARVIVGTRSAVFTPLPEAGLLIVDEEHDGSYKQQDGIRYHARDFALVRGKALDVPVVLGSATPSLESLHNARAGRYTHLRLQQRAGDARPPAVRVFDVRKRPLQDGLSPEVLAGIEQHLRAGNQVLVFKNRRGYAPVLLCHDCGWTAPCSRCSTPLHTTPMTVHGAGRRLQCHHCGARAPVPLACPDCASLALQPQGIGTERLEERLLQLFPDFPVLRIDRGTTARRDALEQTLATLGEQPGILVGTQILAKGHDLPRLTLVVVVGIDEGLFSADFRASEKLAQQLIQVAGRAGRADRPGEVWLQTHHPDNALLHTLVNGGYHAFADAELAQREAAGFPPFAHLALMRAEARQVEHANAFLATVKQAIPAASPVECYGPMPAPMPRRAGFQRAQLLLSATQRRALHGLLDTLMPQVYLLPQARRVRWSLDVDPMDLY